MFFLFVSLNVFFIAGSSAQIVICGQREQNKTSIFHCILFASFCFMWWVETIIYVTFINVKGEKLEAQSNAHWKLHFIRQCNSRREGNGQQKTKNNIHRKVKHQLWLWTAHININKNNKHVRYLFSDLCGAFLIQSQLLQIVCAPNPTEFHLESNEKRILTMATTQKRTHEQRIKRIKSQPKCLTPESNKKKHRPNQQLRVCQKREKNMCAHVRINA